MTPPRVYRSRHQIAIFTGIGLFYGAIAIGMFFEARTTVGLVTLAVFLIVFLLSSAKLAYSGVFPDDEKVRIVNYLSSFDLKWTEIEKFEVRRWGIFPYVCRITLLSGEQKHAIGIQERTNFPDGSGERMVEELNREVLARRSASDAAS